MNAYKLICLAPLVYIVWWFWTLIATIIPTYSQPLNQLGEITVWFIVGTTLFLTLGVALLIIAIASFAYILAA